jgi:putative ABC transport system permease protein
VIPFRAVPLVLKYVTRHRIRSVLTISGVGLAMFLFCAVQAMRSGVDDVTRRSAEETTLVVYRQNRFCPFTSRLPEDYGSRIARLPGVATVTPMQIVVNNCRASLDVVTFRGVPMEAFEGAFDVELLEGSISEWQRRTDSALVGERLAKRRGIKVGDQLAAAGINVHVAGIVVGDNPQDQTVAYVHLGFLQRAAGNRQGVVTQFNVRVTDPALLDPVAAAIDAEFATAQAPTWTSSEKAFTARAVTDIVELVRFAGWLGIGSLIAIFALVANAISLSVQDRVKDHAVMQTIGYPESLIVRLIVAESLVLSLIGGSVGVAAAMVVSWYGQFTFSVEGMSVVIQTGGATILLGMAICASIGILAGLMPAFRAARLSTVEAFRAV